MTTSSTVGHIAANQAQGMRAFPEMVCLVTTLPMGQPHQRNEQLAAPLEYHVSARVEWRLRAEYRGVP